MKWKISDKGENIKKKQIAGHLRFEQETPNNAVNICQKIGATKAKNEKRREKK